MNGPQYDQTQGAPKVDPRIKEFDTATALWVVVVGALGFLVAIRRGMRPPVISS